jgi:hypothetical protein
MTSPRPRRCTRSTLGISRPLKKWPKGVRSKFSVDESLEIRVNSPKIRPDPDSFNRLLTNVLRHAQTSAAQVRMRVDSQQIEITVTDQGAGSIEPLRRATGLDCGGSRSGPDFSAAKHESKADQAPERRSKSFCLARPLRPVRRPPTLRQGYSRRVATRSRRSLAGLASRLSGCNHREHMALVATCDRSPTKASALLGPPYQVMNRPG